MAEARGSCDDRVADHWPECGANGEGGIRVRHVLSHTSGVRAGHDAPG